MAELQYWDSCLFINFLTALEKDKVDCIRDLIAQAKATPPRIAIVISNLVLAEVRQLPTYDDNQVAIIKELFDVDRPYLRFSALTSKVATRASDIGVQFPDITVPDAVHIATALHEKAEVLFTYDGAKDKARRRSGDLLQYDKRIGNPPLRIEEPWVDLGPMFRAQQLSSGAAETQGE